MSGSKESILTYTLACVFDRTKINLYLDEFNNLAIVEGNKRRDGADEIVVHNVGQYHLL